MDNEKAEAGITTSNLDFEDRAEIIAEIIAEANQIEAGGLVFRAALRALPAFHPDFPKFDGVVLDAWRISEGEEQNVLIAFRTVVTTMVLLNDRNALDDQTIEDAIQCHIAQFEELSRRNLSTAMWVLENSLWFAEGASPDLTRELAEGCLVDAVELEPMMQLLWEISADSRTQVSRDNGVDFDPLLFRHDDYQAEAGLQAPFSVVGLVEALHQSGRKWRFWSEFYEAILEGASPNFALLQRIAAIEDGIWKAGPDAVASEIERIRSRWAVESALTDLKDGLKIQTGARHGIGGNNPPESLQDERLYGAVTLIWEAEEELSTALEEENPAREWIASILEKLKVGSLAITKWIGRKADLAVDTAIVTAIKQGGPLVGGYYALDKLIKAIEDWLPFLP